MGFADKYNKVTVNKFTFSGDSTFDFMSLEDLYTANGKDEVYTLRGLWINPKGNFGPAPVGVLNDCYVNLPGHLLETVENIMQDDEACDMINEGLVGFTIHTYFQEKYKKDCYGINFVDIKPDAKDGFIKIPEGIEQNLPFN